MLIEEVTLGQVLVSVTFVISLGAAIKKLKKEIDNWFKDQLTPKIEPITNSIKDLDKKIDRMEMESYKSWLVLFMSNIERGEHIDEVEYMLFEEVYKKYTERGGNSYVHRKYDKLKAEGKL